MKTLYATLVLAGFVAAGCAGSAGQSNNGGSGGGGSGGNEQTGGAGASGGDSGSSGGGGARGGDSGSGGGGSGGAAGVSGGGAGGVPKADAASETSPDAQAPDRSASDRALADDGPTALEECKTPSIDRIQSWNATGEGTTLPMKGSLLVKEGDRYVARQQFLKNTGSDPWHVLEVWPGNSFDAKIDLSKSSGFTLTYSSTAKLWLQMRPSFHYDGGAQWATDIPSTGGQMKTQTFSFDPAQWVVTPLGKPDWTYAEARKSVTGFLFVGDTLNKIAFYGLRIDGYVPVCR